MMDSMAGAGGSVAFFTSLDADRRAQIIGAVLGVALFLYREIVTEEGSFCSDVQLKPLQRSQLRYMPAHGGFANGHGVSEMIVAERVVALGTGVDVGGSQSRHSAARTARFGAARCAVLEVKKMPHFLPCFSLQLRQQRRAQLGHVQMGSSRQNIWSQHGERRAAPEGQEP